MRNITLKIIHCFCLLGIMGMLVMCSDNLLEGQNGEDSAPEGYVRISAPVKMAPMMQVQTRAVDPDSKGIESMRLYCFDENGLFVTTVSTTLELYPEEDTGYYLSGKFTANIPNYIHCVHIVANQTTDAFRESDYLGKSEKTVMTGLIASSSNMVYWGRVEAGMALEGTTAGTNETLAETFDRIMSRTPPDNCVHLVRNQARVQVSEKSGVGFDLEGFYVCNTNAFGTIAPYNEEAHAFDWVTSPSDRNYITLPPNLAKSTDPTEVDNSDVQYIFETENTLTDPVSVIVKGKNNENQSSQYYRILIQDKDYNTMLIKRNHSYNIQITGALSPGYSTFTGALTGTPVNNVYFTVADEINSITNSLDDTQLWVQMTDTVVVMSDARKALEFKYTYKAAATPKQNDVTVVWTGNQDVAGQSFGNSVSVSGNTLNGTVRLDLLSMGERLQREGTLLIKAGPLMRTVKIITIKEQTFVPTWVSSMVYNGIAGQNFTLMFSVPDDCPQELFPFDVMVSAPDMDVRSATGMRLDVVTKVSDPVRYGNDVTYMNSTEVIGYKYVYPVTEPGTQRIYFKTTFVNQEDDQITLENPYFETMKRAYAFSNESKVLEFVDMATGSVDDLPGNTGTGGEDVFYYIVPRKINAPVSFSFIVKDYKDLSTPAYLSIRDELLFYTSHLNKTEQGNSPLEFTEERQDRNVSGLPWGIYVKEAVTPEKYTVNMLTNTPNSAEVVRLSSNLSESFYPGGTGGTYNGNKYRSTTFELANYRAFEFNAGVSADGITDPMQMNQKWTYEYGQQVDIAFDVTSFTATTALQESVDPFGTSFKVYIDAPMLEIDKERMNAAGISSAKFYEEDGRFVYVVDANRETERQDAAGYSVATVENNGQTYRERKVLPFRTSKIVNAGNISISAQEDVVDFTSQTFTVTNKPITGNISYIDGTSNQVTNVPNLAFVSFERTRDNTRIGTVMVGENGSYRLMLRGEYTYDWAGTEYVEFKYVTEDGKIYSTLNQKMTLADLFANPDVVLEEVK